METFKKVTILVLVLVFLSFSPLKLFSASAETEKIRVGLLLAVTGWFSSAGLAEKDECEAVLSILNEKGLKIGNKVYNLELVIEDTQSTLEGVALATNKLVYEKKVKFIVGPNAFWGSASAPICEAEKIFNVIGYCTNTPGQLDKNTKFRVLAENGTMGHMDAMLKYIKKAHPKLKKFVIAHPEDGSIPYLKPLMKKALQDYGMEMVGEVVSFSNELVDFTPIAMKLSRIKEADAILIPNAIGKHVGSILKGLRELGDERWVFYCGVGRMDDIVTWSGKPAGKKVASCAVHKDATDNPPQLATFLKRYYAKRDEKSPVILQNSTALYALPQLLEAAQSLDPETIVKTLPKINKINTLWGEGVLCGDKTYGLVHHAIAHPLPIQFLDEKGEFKYGGWIKDVYVP